AKTNQSTGWLNSVAGAFCGTLQKVTDSLTKSGQEIERWIKGASNANDKTPDTSSIAGYGNVTYRALGALGYEDGFSKDVILSLLGMSIVLPTPAKDCTEAFSLFESSTLPGSESAIDVITKAEAARTVAKDNAKASDTASSATTQKNAGDSEKSISACHAPPLITQVKDIANLLLCGLDPKQNAALFAANYYGGDAARFKATSIAMMCPTDKETVGTNAYDFYVYTCRADAKTKDCIAPKMEKFGNYARSVANLDGYDGLVFMVGAKLFNGVLAVRDGKSLPPTTTQLIQAVDYPLYRLINLAAVYPGAAGTALEAYAATIAVQYVSDTLGLVVKVGSQPSIDFRNQMPVGAPIVNQIRAELANTLKGDLINKNQTLSRLSEKRALVDLIVQSNKALQSEVISQGLGSNAEMALSLKLQTKPAAPK
ncbi:conjugal transfer protein TraH, partial [Comamonas thiooxydans]|uniref:conjugal transfer protein TraH n=1 Tax=Comamonas thiooxydans TaxID=363952 RepID=UPI0011847899